MSISHSNSSIASPSSPVSVQARAEIAEFNAWMAKYDPVERAIIEAREKRLARKVERKEEHALIFGDFCEATEGRAKAWRRKGLSFEQQIDLSEGDAWSIACLTRYYGHRMTRVIDKMRHQLKRPLYYEAENARRRGLAAERRKVKRRSTTNACPTREQILDAWIHLKDSHEATIRFGSLIEDLSCYVDHSLRFDDNGNICGRNGGVKAWLQENIPALAMRYTTVMRYKAAARKLKQITGIADPTPADTIVGRVAQPGLEHGVRPAKSTRCVGGAKASAVAQGAGSDGGGIAKAEDAAKESGDYAECGRQNKEIMHRTKKLSVELVRARAIWVEIVTGIRTNPTALVARLNELVDPERVADATMLAAWKERYGNEITVRTKHSWWRRLWSRKGSA